MKLMKYSYPSRALTFIGPQRSECIISEGTFALRPFPLKYFMVIFLSRKDSHGDRELLIACRNKSYLGLLDRTMEPKCMIMYQNA